MRILLIEGAAGAFTPATGYCKQGQKVWFTFGKPAKLHESFHGMTLVETIDGLELEERTIDGRKVKMPKGGVWVVEGPAQASDKRNANNRYYPRTIWEKWIADSNSSAQQAIKERAMVGHLEHPADGRTDGNKLAMVVTHAELRESGDVHARFELLDTPEGLRLQEYTRKGIKWGVSSRGTGSVDEKGRVSPDDYVLETWDAVMRPSVTGAHPRLSQSESDEGTPAHSSVATGSTSGASETMAPDHVSKVEAVETLCSSSIDELDETARRDLRDRLLPAVRQLRNMPANKRVQDAVASAFWKLASMDTVGSANVDELIESACRDATRSATTDGESTLAAEVIQGLREAAGESAEEAEELRAKLEVAESELLSAKWRITELTEQLSQVESSHRATRTQLKTARGLLAGRPAQGGGVREAVDDVVAQVPQLEEFRSHLEQTTSAEAVADLAETLLRLALRTVMEDVVVSEPTPPAPVTEPIVERSRPTLPQGVVTSEKDAGKRSLTESKAPQSRGVRLAAGAVSRMS